MAKSDNVYVELDWADENDPHAEKHAKDLGLKAEVVVLNGPGGGWPIIGFTGPRDAVNHLILGREDEIEIVQVCDICGSHDNGDITDGICSTCPKF
jgi:hypothetical protein